MKYIKQFESLYSSQSTPIDIDITNEEEDLVGSVEGVMHYTREKLSNWLYKESIALSIDEKLIEFPVAILKNININEEYRNKGYGNEAMCLFLDETYLAKSIFLMVDIREDNKFKLEDWYKGYGFENVGRGGEYPVMMLKNESFDYSEVTLDDGIKLIKNNNRSIKAGKDIYLNDENSYDIYYNSNNIGFIHIIDKKDHYQISNITIKIERLGIAYNIYKKIINMMDKPLISDISLNYKTIGLWNKLVKNGLAEKIEDNGKIRYRSIKNLNESTYTYTDIFEFEDESVGFHHGQTDMIMNMYLKDSEKLLAKVNYVIYNNEITISFIESFVKGFGYGQELMKELAKKYGYKNLKRSGLTDSGINLRKKLDKYFEFDYDKYKDSLCKHYNIEIINNIKNPIIKKFLELLVNFGYNYAWEKMLKNSEFNKLKEKVDLNDVVPIAEWIKGSKVNDNYQEDSPPDHVVEEIKKLSKI